MSREKNVNNAARPVARGPVPRDRSIPQARPRYRSARACPSRSWVMKSVFDYPGHGGGQAPALRYGDGMLGVFVPREFSLIRGTAGDRPPPYDLIEVSSTRYDRSKTHCRGLSAIYARNAPKSDSFRITCSWKSRPHTFLLNRGQPNDATPSI